MLKSILLFFVIILMCQAKAQMVEIIIPGSVNNYESKAKIFGATLYLVQDGVTMSKTITTSAGDYNIIANINKNKPFELIVSKPNYITKKVYFDFKTLTFKGQSGSIQALEELIVELFAIRQGVVIVTGSNEYAEKFTWDNDQKIAVPDEQHKKLSDDKIINLYKIAERDALTSIFLSKAEASAKAKNYVAAISYTDSVLAIKQNDSIALVKKGIFQKEIANIEAANKKSNEVSSLLLSGKTLSGQGDFVEAISKFNQALKIDPSNVEALAELTKTKLLSDAKKAQDKSANDLSKFKKNADEFETKSKYTEAINELNKALKLSLTKNQNDSIVAKIADLKLKNQGVSVENQITKELGLAKQFDVKKEYSKSKENYLKIEKLLQELDPNSAKSKLVVINNQLAESLKTAIKDANTLNSNSDYEKAILAYKQTEILINSLFDVDLKLAKLDEIKVHILEVEGKRNEEVKKYNDAINNLKTAIDNAPATLAAASLMLTKDPLKSKSNVAEVKDLKARIDKLNTFYSDKKIKLKAQKDSLQAQKAISDIYNKAISLKISTVELAKIKFSSDSINAIVNSKMVSKGQTNRSGLILSAPGTLSTAANASESFEQLEFTRMSIEKGKTDYLIELKNELDADNYFRNTKQESTNELASQQIKQIVTDVDVLNEQKNKEAIKYDKSLTKLIQDNDYIIYQRELEASLQQDAAAKKAQNDINKKDAYLLKEQLKSDTIANNSAKNIQAQLNDLDLRNEKLSKKNDSTALDFQVTKNQLEVSSYRRDSISNRKQELAASDFVKQNNYKENIKNIANYIKDEKGVCFPWNALTELVYDIKNADGFVVSVIVRRVVVDQYGYGVVFEHTRNEKGISSFTMNGTIITETIWFNQSSGVGVIIPNLVVKTDC